MKKARWIAGDVLIMAAPFIMSGVGSCIWCVIPAAGCLIAGIVMTLEKIMEFLEESRWLYEK